MRVLFLIAVLLPWAGCSRGETINAVPSVAPTATPSFVLPETVTSDPKGKKPWAFQEIDGVVAATGKRNLRDVELGQNDLEIRVWGGFGMTATQGFILNRTKNRWSAAAIRPEFRKPRTWKFNVVTLAEPGRSWDSLWQELLKHGILTLPDAETINCTAMIEDGYSYVVEVRKGKSYRTYSYDNPASQFENRCAEADKILNIARIISDDYGATGF